MKSIKYILVSFLLMSILYACQKDDHATDYKNFLGGREVIYTGAVSKVIVQPGNLEIGLKWKASTDANITGYVIYYNNKADSQIVNISGKPDTVKAVIKNLDEYTYSFTIYSFDAKGNRSVPFEVNNAKAYGPIYAGNLLNRGYDASTPYVLNDDGSLLLNFITPDTINIKTEIKYTNAAGVENTAILLPAAGSITLPSYKLGSTIQYKSYYIPERTAIDTFSAPQYDVFPRVYSYVQCDKSLFKALSLPNDVHADFGTSMEKMWDGSVGPQGYPDIFHSNEAQLPHHFTFDMGKIYDNLGRLEETGRNQSHNPLSFEVWGIADITGAETTVPGTDANWASQMQAKGWTLLKDCLRTDNGQAPVKFDITSNPPPVRYIRIRVKTNASGEKYSNISEFTFWNKQ